MVKYLTTREVAERLRISPGSVCEIIKRGEFSSVLKDGRRYLIPDSELDAYIKRKTCVGPVESYRRSLGGGNVRTPKRQAYVPKKLNI